MFAKTTECTFNKILKQFHLFSFMRRVEEINKQGLKGKYKVDTAAC